MLSVSEAIKKAPEIEAEDGERILSEVDVEEIADALFANLDEFTREADELVKAVMKVLHYFVYEPSMSARETSKNFLHLALYRRTDDCARRLQDFERRAGCREE